ncbi:putative homeodomain-interacting protein kinase 3-like [Scophthalmus maximus]|uniref:Putative homeodomain-interacting protein kinase 3-like n=1 Tax=Scophthalmus maximus TaxID=52904 RepID=A0A2U9CYQ0_SCOMX|nr:putative homeodomain-interacting protein kinase 3-like [Scophthalmus maximus]
MSTLSSPSSQYLVQSILKEGSYEKLTKCVNIATRKTVYLKILNSRSALPEKEKELLILKHLRKFDPDNFNIVRCNSVFFKAEKIFIEYEMLGQTLFDFVKDRPSHCMTLNEIRPILHQLQHMVQTLGPHHMFPQKMLNDGLNTKRYFQREKSSTPRWRLKDPSEYGQTKQTGNYFKCLDNIQKLKPVCRLSEEDTRAEFQDRQDFGDLLKGMLHLDCDKRITPSQMFQHPFITINYLAKRYPNSFYVNVCCGRMEVCRHQCLSSDKRGYQSVLRYQPIPAWYTHREHPLILQIASAMNSLSMYEDQSPPQPQQLSLSTSRERTLSELQLPNAPEKASHTGTITPVRQRDTSEPPKVEKKAQQRTRSSSRHMQVV